MMKRTVAILALLACALAGCAQDTGPPPIRAGTPCAACGMEIADARFACERRVEDRWRAYDAIECLLREGVDGAVLSDYDSKTLHWADSLWVVRGAFPSPMGGGYAAFLERSSADDVAQQTHGRVRRLADFVNAEQTP